MRIGEAIEAMESGKKVCRAGWNGKGMFLFLVDAGIITHPVLNDEHDALPYIAMRTVTGQVVPWLASQTDILSLDWEVAE